MSNQPTEEKTVLGVRLDPETIRLARIHRAETGEFVNNYVRRLIHEDHARKREPKPAA
jgi:hypothetical protein